MTSRTSSVGFVGPLPGFAEQARLIGGRERGRFADVDVGGAKTDDGGDDRVDDVSGRNDQQPDRTTDALGERDDIREQPPLVRRGRASAGGFLADVHVDQPRGHDDDVAIAGRLKRGRHVRERVRIANGHQHVAGTGVDLIERQFCREQQIERVVVGRSRRRGACARPRSTTAPDEDGAPPTRSPRRRRTQRSWPRAAAMTPGREAPAAVRGGLSEGFRAS